MIPAMNNSMNPVKIHAPMIPTGIVMNHQPSKTVMSMIKSIMILLRMVLYIGLDLSFIVY